MSSIVMMRFADRVDVYSDTLGYDEKGVAKMFTPKVFTLLPQRTLFGYRGPVPAAQFYHLNVVQRRDFDDILRNAAMDVLFAAETSKAMGFPFLLIVNLAGWSNAAGQFILARCGVDGVKQTRPAVELMTSQFSSDPPLPNRRMDEFLTPEGAFQFEGDATVRRWFEAQRDTNYAIPGGASGCLVGGQLQHTWLTSEGFAGTRFLHEWPDEIGRPVERAPVDGPRDEYVDVAWGEWSPPTGEPAHLP